MFVLRLVAALAVVAIGATALAFLFTRDRRYLLLAWRIVRYTVVVALVILALFFLERVAVL